MKMELYKDQVGTRQILRGPSRLTSKFDNRARNHAVLAVIKL